MLTNPTPYLEINRLLQELFEQAREILGSGFIGMYLDGSLVTGAFDQNSDIDFVVVTSEDVTEEQFVALQAMHDRLAALDTPWAIQLEGSYISQAGLRHDDPAHRMHPNIERGEGERLKWVSHDFPWDIHRHILREQGIPLAGPNLRTLIDPVSPERLRQAALFILTGWASGFLEEPGRIQTRGYQSYIVLSMCRILYTLEFGEVATKPAAARWAVESLGEPWTVLIERAWEGRGPGLPLLPEDVRGTLSFIRYTLALGRGFIPPRPAG